MIGVEILATQDVATAFTFNWLSFWMAVAMCMGICLTIGVIVSVAEGDLVPFVALCIMGIMAGLLFGAIVGAGEGVPIEYETRYKVTISDEVPMNDFLERYEILDQEGKIYTVRERGVEDGEK